MKDGRVRRSRSLVVTFEDERPTVVSYHAGDPVDLDALALDLLVATGAWSTPESLFARFADRYDRAELARALLSLVDLGFVVVSGSPEAALDERFASEWEWGAIAGLFHFGIKNAVYESPDGVRQWMAARASERPLVALERAPPDAGALALPAPSRGEMFDTMRRRRSERCFDPEAPLPVAVLADCLFCGFGIVGHIEPDVPGGARLPLAMTPSGGARNPYEAFVVARNVAALAPGVYHYAGRAHRLARVNPEGQPLPALPALLGGQAWFEHAGAVVLLAATFPRTSWKYPHPGGLRVVLIEAGHIAQNILLGATHHGVAATPTCAISDDAVETLCGLDPVTQGVVYAVALGVRSAQASAADPVRVIA